MHAKDVIRNTIEMSDRIFGRYLDDLSDADLLVRPVEGMNNTAWQIGHLIMSERSMLESIKPGSSPALPEGFDEGHGREKFTENDPAKFLPLAKYRELWKAQRDATYAVLETLSDDELDAPSDERFRKFIPTVGGVMNMIGSHVLMHAGQLVAVRRLTNKPVVI